MDAEFADEKARVQAAFGAELEFNRAERRRLQRRIEEFSATDADPREHRIVELSATVADLRCENETLQQGSRGPLQNLDRVTAEAADRSGGW